MATALKTINTPATAATKAPTLGELNMKHDPAKRGYHAMYREHQVNHCPGCGRTHWLVGRHTAECAFCATALPLDYSSDAPSEAATFAINDNHCKVKQGHDDHLRPVTVTTTDNVVEMPKSLFNNTARGYHAVYRENETNHCPGCGRTHWLIGRMSAECGFCATALPLDAGLATPASGSSVIAVFDNHSGLNREQLGFSA